MKKILVTLAFLLSLIATQAGAITAYYQPTPYPLKKMDGSAMPQSLSIVHVQDGWINSYYSSLMSFQRDDKLKMGGWGDVYRSYLNFDLTGLPSSPTNVAIWFRFYPSGSATTNFQFCIPSTSWDTSLTWGSQPSFLGCTAMQPAPTTDSWAGWYITPWYQSWQNNSWGKFGLMLNPQSNSNNYNFIRSSRYANFSADPYADGKRPMLQFDFTPTLQLKMPLPGGYRWLLTNETGGYECMGQSPWPDVAHQGSNYFSIDLTWNNYNNSGGVTTYGRYNTPVLAAAGGKVIIFSDSGAGYQNGYYVVVNHNYDSVGNTGFSTRYLHLYAPPARKNGTLLKTGDTVNQGDQIGIMGTTGSYNGVPTSTGEHVHFGIRYNNDGSSSNTQISSVIMDSLLLKSYQTECSQNSNGVPTARIRYFTSSNTPTGY